MKLIALHGKRGEGKYAKVDDEDYELVSRYRWHVKSNGYACRDYRIDGMKKTMMMHRLIMGDPVDLEIDHRNHDKLDNLKSNLRVATSQQNKWNTGAQKNSSSGQKCIFWSELHNKWRVQVQKNGKKIEAGLFTSLDDAIKERDVLFTQLHGAFADVR